MASLNREKQHGKDVWRVSYYDKDGNRKKIRLGVMGKKAAEMICFRIGQLVDATAAGLAPDPELTNWLGKIGQELSDKLITAGLISARASSKLKEFLDDYLAMRHDARPNTVRNLRMAARSLVAFFGENRNLRDISAGTAEEWKQHMLKTLSEATTSRQVKRARQFFSFALQKGLVASNVFLSVKVGSERNDSRVQFIDRATIEKVIAAAPNAEWRLIIALARYGGLRTPSETLALKWSDINWVENRIVVPSTKTARYGKGYRVMPLFPELRPFLVEADELAPNGSIYVIHRYRDATNANLRTQFQRIIRKAGVESWERLFHNLRASRQTELTDEFPAHVVASWLGNSARIAELHYLKTHEQHFAKALKGPQGGARGGAKVGQHVGLHTHALEDADVQHTAQNAEKTGLNRELVGSAAHGCEGDQYPWQDSNLRPPV